MVDLQRKQWFVKNLDFDDEGRLVIYDKSLQEWFLANIVNASGGSILQSTAGAPPLGGPLGTIGAAVSSAVSTVAANADCDVIVVGKCKPSNPDLDKNCDILVVKSCGTKPPSPQTSCDTASTGNSDDTTQSQEDIDQQWSSVLGVIIRDNSKE